MLDKTGKGPLYNGDLLFFVIVLILLRDRLDDLIDGCESILSIHIGQQRMLNRLLPRHILRPTFQQFMETINPSHFKRMFRMPVATFEALCDKIRKKVGDAEFKSESYLGAIRQRLYGSAEPREQTNPPVSGELTVALSIRMLAGGSYLDLVPLFKVSSSALYDCFDTFLDWILETLQFPLMQWLTEQNWAKIKKLATAFGDKTSNIFYGPFAALDGLAIRIRAPTLNDVPDPKNYYCRKGFFALNVQAMCDKFKYFLWCFPSNKGSTHDSVAFAGSKMYELLEQMASELKAHGLFVAADSAYSLAAYMETPFDKSEMLNDVYNIKDAFNFYLSSCRIYIECAFGELVMRWGILWRTLQFSLKKCMKIIQVCMLLHNFILDNQEDNERNDTSYFEHFNIDMDQTQRILTQKTNEIPIAMVSDNNEPKPRGRVTAEKQSSREEGEAIRLFLAMKLNTYNLKRPLQDGMQYNDYGHVYITH